MKFGKQLVEQRNKTRLSLPDAARMMGLPKSLLSNLESNKAQNPGVKTLTKIGNFYGIKFVIP